MSALQTVWFCAIVALWMLYLVLEGFDFGVGMLMRRVRRDHADRRVALNAIGPTWAANEVWVVVAVVAMFGAFPGWYAAWSSGFYLPLALVLLALIARNGAIELIGKRAGESWRAGWERVLVVASTVAPFCWGLIWSAAVHGLALRGGDVVAGPLDVISWYSLLGGLSLVALSRVCGAAFLSLRTADDVRIAASRELRRAAPFAVVLVGVMVGWTVADAGGSGLGTIGWIAAAGCVAALLVVVGGAVGRRAGIAFAAGCAAIALLVVTWLAVLFPAGIAGAGGGPAMQLADVAAGDYTLKLMTGLTVVLLPVLLALQAWSYWLFRHRITRADVGEAVPSPVEALVRVVGSRPADPASPRAEGAAVPLTGPGFRRRRRR